MAARRLQAKGGLNAPAGASRSADRRALCKGPSFFYAPLSTAYACCFRLQVSTVQRHTLAHFYTVNVFEPYFDLLKHTQATQLCGCGMDIKEIPYRLGHAEASTTLDTYAKLVPAKDYQAAEIIGALLSKAKREAEAFVLW